MNSRLRLPVALIVAVAVIGAWFQSRRGLSPDPEPKRTALRTPPESSRWHRIEVATRPFPPDTHAEQGERMYGWNCMPCHGVEGKGDGPVAQRMGLRPRDFTRGIFKLKSSHPDELPFDEDLYRSISTGFPQGAMPGFEDFSVEELWSLVDHVKSLAQRTTPEGATIRWFELRPARTRLAIPSGREPGDPERGARLFREVAQCVRCHGEQGRADGPAAPTLLDADDKPSTLPDFAHGELAFKAGTRAEDVYRVLSTGLAGTPMPSFLAMPEADRWDLAWFVTTKYEPVAPGVKLFLTRGCAQCHTVGKGRLVGPDLAGVGKRRDREWIRRWIKDPPGMLRSDEQARQLAKDYPVPMPDLKIADAEIALLVEYLATLTAEGSR